MKFVKSLKFKLTIWYSLILSVFCIAFVVSINIWLTNYMKNWTPEEDMQGRGFLIERIDRPRLRSLSEEQRIIVMESRMEDLENIRVISIYMVLPLVLMSFGGGYLMASIMLRPLSDLKDEVQKKEAQNLNEEIVFEDNGDEISELIKSFNRMSNRLSKSFESQKQFVENASHELKTPLSVIQANIDTILNDKEIPKKKLKKLVGNSKKQISFMNDLIEDLLLLSAISTSKFNIEFEEIDISKVIRVSTNVLAEKIKEKDLELEIKEQGGNYLTKGNKVLLERAFSNILDNSLKYSKGKSIVVGISSNSEDIKISFKDDGKGVAKTKVMEIFERFYRLDKGRSRKDGGSGLGLAITKEIVERHGGQVYVNTKYSKGAEFIIKLPKVS